MTYGDWESVIVNVQLEKLTLNISDQLQKERSETACSERSMNKKVPTI